MIEQSRGYTLVELMITVAVLSILAVIAIPAYQGYISTARQAAARANIEPLRIALEDYRLDHMNTGYTPFNGLVWEPPPSTERSLEDDMGWKPDGDKDQYTYAVTADATTYTITVTPIGHKSDAQSYTKD